MQVRDREDCQPMPWTDHAPQDDPSSWFRQSLRIDVLNIPPDSFPFLILSFCFPTERIRLFENQLRGRVPRQYGGMTDLQQLYVHYNDLTGVVPQDVCAIQGLGKFLT